MHKLTLKELESSPVTNVLASSTEDNKKLLVIMEFGVTHYVKYEIRTNDNTFVTNFGSLGDAIKFYNQMGKDK